MARVSIIVSSLRSSLFRTLFLANTLRDAGHDIVIFGSQDVGEIVLDNGFELREIPEPWVNPFTSPLTRPRMAERLSLSRRRARAKETIAHYQIDDLANMLRDAAPDLVIINAELHAHIIVARGLGLKVALVASIYITAPSLSSPPLHFAQVPGRGFGGSRYGIGGAWMYYLLRKRLLFLRNTLRDWGGDHVTALGHLASRSGVNLRGIRRVNSWQMPWVYRLPTLLMLPHALDLPKKHWPHFRFVGGDTAIAQAGVSSDLSAFSEFTQPRQIESEKRILISFGSFLRPQGSIVAALFEAVRANPDWRVLFVVKEKFHDRLPPCPDNLQLAPWAPLRALMPHADVIVNHAGNATILEAVEARLPMLAYPINNDQFGAGARLAYHNIGIVGTTADDARAVESHIETLSSDPSIKDALAEMQKACRVEIESGAALHAVDDLLNNRWAGA